MITCYTLYRRVNEANFGWRALRLLARRSLHFFTHGNTPITRLPDYLETHVRKLAKDMQVKRKTMIQKFLKNLFCTIEQRLVVNKPKAYVINIAVP